MIKIIKINNYIYYTFEDLKLLNFIIKIKKCSINLIFKVYELIYIYEY